MRNKSRSALQHHSDWGLRASALLLLAMLAWAGAAGAQTLPSNPSQFDVTGFIQSATLDNPGSLLSSGTITINDQLIVVPANTILQMPAAALTWQLVFALAPAPYGIPGNPGVTGLVAQSGLAMNDVPTPMATYEAHVQGNRVGNTYIAGLIFLSQHSLQSSQGFINFIDYTTGEFRVGGTMGNPNTGQRVKINDPDGKFGRAWTPDIRFTIDENNPTVRSETGFPMCVPRVAPSGVAGVETDAACPQFNRPADPTSPSGFLMTFVMPGPAAVVPGVTPDPRIMAPFEVGDYVTYSGLLVSDPAPATTTYIAAYQVIGNVGLFTAPGVDPAYVAVDVMLLGTGGQTVAGLVEATARTRFEGFTSDPSRNILLYGIDVNPCSGTQTPRDWGAMNVDPGPPRGAVMGRWRFRPPTSVLRMPAAGAFLPPTREFRAAIETIAGSGIPASPFLDANGVVIPGSSFYQAPIFDFLFPENIAVGSPVVPNNFDAFPFLAQGSGPLDALNLIGQLAPWPGLPAPAGAACGGAPPPPAPAPVAKIVVSPSSTVLQKTLVTLDASGSTGTAPLSFVWSATPAGLILSSATGSIVTFTSPSLNVDTTFTLTVVVTDATGQTGTASANVLVKASSFTPQAPVVKVVVLPSPVYSGALVTMDASGSTDPQGLALTFAWSGPNPPLAPGQKTSKVVFTAPTVAVPTNFTFSLNVSNGPKTTSVNVVVTVNPKDTITFSRVEYRISLLRLIVDAASTNANAVLTLQAWADAAETIPLGPPVPLVLNTAVVPAVLEAILVGYAQPDHVTVTSNFGGVARSPILTVR